MTAIRRMFAKAISNAKKALSKAQELASKYNNGGKAIASDGTTNTISGWANNIDGAAEFNRLATPQTIMNKSDEIGHTLKPDYRDQGIPGQFNASHAEKQLSALSSKEIGVTIKMCPDCVEYFKKLAQYEGVEKVVADPVMTRIFKPNGTIEEILH